jgi:hypothetical protein
MSYDTNGATHGDGQSTVDWRPGNITIVTPTEGTRSYIDTLASSFEAANVPYRITPMEGPYARIESVITGSSTPTEDPITTEVRFSTKGSVVPVEEHPDYVSALEALITGWASVDENNVALGLKTLADYHGGTSTDDLDAAKLADIQEPTNGLVPFSRKILGGTKSYLRPEPMLIVVTTYQPSAAFVPDLAEVGVVYTNAQLDSGLGLSTAVEGALPSGQWLCDEVDLDFQSTGTKVVTQSFRYAIVWDSDLYEHAP